MVESNLPRGPEFRAWINIAGYLQSLAARLADVDRRALELQTSSDDAHYITVPTGFASFSRLQKEYEQKFCAKVRARCRVLEAVCRECADFFQRYLPVRRVLPEPPKMTPGFLSSTHYHELFLQIVAWYRLGKLTVLGERYLYGLRTLDKLYEFFCLYRIVEALEQQGWKLDETYMGVRQQSPDLMWDTRPAEQFTFLRLGGERIKLFYELSLYNTAKNLVDLLVTEYSVSSNRPIRERRPDFIIEYGGTHKATYIILDAKYSTRSTVWNHHLPALTMKYLHGLGSASGGYPPISALFLLHPRAPHNFSDQHDSFHQQYSDMFSNRPTLPILGAIEVSPDEPPEVPGASAFPLSRILDRMQILIKPGS